MKYIKQLTASLLLASFALLFVPQSSQGAYLEFANPGSPTTYTATGVVSASSSAPDFNMATLLSGENQTLNRMMITPAYTCFATTTDTLVKTGYGILGSSFIASHSSDVTLSFYDGTTTGALSSIIVQDFVLSAGTASQKTWGGEFATGLYLDITGTGTTTVCYR